MAKEKPNKKVKKVKSLVDKKGKRTHSILPGSNHGNISTSKIRTKIKNK